MHEDTELIIRFSKVEVQQALSIWLDNDAQEALRFVEEKIVGKTLGAGCRQAVTQKTAPCHLTRLNCACCRGAARVNGMALRRQARP